MQVEVSSLPCPLCRCARRRFFCAACIRGGDFAVLRSERAGRARRGCSPFITPARPGPGPGGASYLGPAPALTRFADVQLRWLTARAAVEEAESGCAALLEARRRERDDPEAETAALERRLAVLRRCVEAKRTAVEWAKRTRREKMAAEVEEMSARLKVAAQDGAAWKHTLERVAARKAASAARLEECRRSLRRAQDARIADLLKWIFPITEEEATAAGGEGGAEGGDESNPSNVVESQLFEALSLTYFQGSWVDLGAPATTPEHRIVAPLLPRFVDSPAFLALLSGAAFGLGGSGGGGIADACALGVGGGGGDGEKRISSNCALFFANQTVQIMAHLLNVRLSAACSLSSFVSANESHAEKCLALARLKRNVVSLCLARGVPATEVKSADEILANLIALSGGGGDGGRRSPLRPKEEEEEEEEKEDGEEAGGSCCGRRETEEEARNRLAEELNHAEAVAFAADRSCVAEAPAASNLPASWESMEHLCPESADRWQC